MIPHHWIRSIAMNSVKGEKEKSLNFVSSSVAQTFGLAGCSGRDSARLACAVASPPAAPLGYDFKSPVRWKTGEGGLLNGFFG